jgi:hypothetical protein
VAGDELKAVGLLSLAGSINYLQPNPGCAGLFEYNDLIEK